MRNDLHSPHRGTGLVDVLDRVLDKGLVIAGDIKVSLAEVELLTIRIRLLVCSIDKAQEIGLDWWRYDQYLAPGRRVVQAEEENVALKKQIATLMKRIDQLTGEESAQLPADGTASSQQELKTAPARPRRSRKRSGG
jgi:hypothetical protein